MGKLSAGEARSRVYGYVDNLDTAIWKLQKNLDDMDFENADRRDRMEEIIQKMKRDCETMKMSLNSLYFEE